VSDLQQIYLREHIRRKHRLLGVFRRLSDITESSQVQTQSIVCTHRQSLTARLPFLHDRQYEENGDYTRNGQELQPEPKRYSDDLRTPNAHKALPPGLTEGTTWTGFTDFTVIDAASPSTRPLTPLTEEAIGETQDTEMLPTPHTTEEPPEKPDEWRLHDGFLVRIHNKKRTALLTPSGLKDSPKLPEELTGTRTTRYKWTGQDKVHETYDNFTGPQAHLSLGYTWTGETCF
jgi:hypothetical protein